MLSPRRGFGFGPLFPDETGSALQYLRRNPWRGLRQVSTCNVDLPYGLGRAARARPKRYLMVPWDASASEKATWCHPMAIDTSSSSPLYQSLLGWAPISAGEVLEMDPTVAFVVATTLPSITVWIWLAVLMHWT
jgi:hypothetical protein